MRKDNKYSCQYTSQFKFQLLDHSENKSILKFIFLIIIKILKNFQSDQIEYNSNILKLQSLINHFNVTKNTIKYIEQVVENEEIKNLNSIIQIFKTCSLESYKNKENRIKYLKNSNFSIKEFLGLEIELEKSLTPTGFKSSDM
jgi:hypothetical protein